MTKQINNSQKTNTKYNMWQNTGFMIGLAWKERKIVLFLSVVLAALAVLNSLAQLYITPIVLKKVETLAPLSDIIATIVLFTVVLLLLAGLAAYVNNNTLFGRVYIRMRIVQMISYKVSTTSFPNTEDTEILKMLSKSINANNSNRSPTEAIWNTLTDLLKNTAGFVLYLFLLSSLNGILMGVVLVTAVFGYLVNKRINEWGFRHRTEEAEYIKNLRYVTEKSRNPALAKDIRIFGMHTWLEDVYNSSFRAYEAFLARRESTYFWTNVIDAILAFCRNGFAYFYLITLALTTNLPTSEFLLYFTAVGGFTTWITGILTNFSTLHQQCLDIDIIREYLETPEPFTFEEGLPVPIPADGKYQIELRDVTYRYPGTQKDTFQHLNLTIHAGEKLAIVGLNGAGKTTLVKLICGFYDPTEGTILLNGKDIRQYNRHNYYELFSAVFQQFSVLEASVTENVTQSFEQPDMPRVEQCIAKAGLTDKIASLPKGYDTNIGRKVHLDGIDLSGGEMQRLMLARALYKNAPIIVLDEPTAALDPIAENEIYLKYNEMTQGCTSLFISHRLASTRFCDRIILVENGAIAEEGTHDSLMAQDGIYASLFGVQSKYYKEGGMDDDQ